MTLTGENKETTIIDGGGSTVVNVSLSDNVEISGFTIQNGGNGIQFYNTSYSTISGNIITNSASDGILFQAHSSNNTVIGNTVKDSNWDGINIQNSSDNFVLSNTVMGNQIGISIRSSSNSNTVSGNNITDNEQGINLSSSSGNSIVGNNVTNNSGNGIWFGSSSNNVASGDTISYCSGTGFGLFGSTNNTLTGNSMIGNTYNFGVGGFQYEDYLQNIDASNTVDGKIVYYLRNQSNLNIDPTTFPNKHRLWICKHLG